MENFLRAVGAASLGDSARGTAIAPDYPQSRNLAAHELALIGADRRAIPEEESAVGRNESMTPLKHLSSTLG